MNLENALVTVFAGVRLALLPERVALNLDTGDLYLADLHVGKSATFRANAIPVPEGDTGADLLRLGRALDRTGARSLVILGDFLHAPASHLDTTWPAWRARRADLDVTVVRGNHDDRAGDPHASWGVQLVSAPLERGGLLLKHHPEPEEKGAVVAGHLHPAVRLRGGGRDRLSLPCFHLGHRMMILPAFTSFAGGASVRVRSGDRVYAIADDTVLDVTALAA